MGEGAGDAPDRAGWVLGWEICPRRTSSSGLTSSMTSSFTVGDVLPRFGAIVGVGVPGACQKGTPLTLGFRLGQLLAGRAQSACVSLWCAQLVARRQKGGPDR